ncbi:MAG: ABC transporter ATP-binding protein [Betaproteobacteria bacterium]|nr:ABC transporter ATP-binding protein [Betaproteobacteria bacterium]NBP33891.1 ABC transporter ATP-binding protein [Betaproteobacteria bacterium]NBP36826.1 ABC transporter ATP-binding protein [Betaproteobacteria bacterium]NBQ77930.1 ABC transporter ATP-binding protein [Betaproteobacteria bacterium]NBQ94803.1 ABC transporter ATP-binding protein [Betaproteobacteria bacterium]
MALTKKPLLEVSKLCAFYGAAQVLFDISFFLRQGEVLALVGPNGAGKSSTLRSIVSWIDRWEGEIRFKGQSLKSLPSHEIAALGIALVPEDRRIFTSLTVAENLELGRQVLKAGRRGPMPAQASGRQAWDLDAVLTLFPALGSMLRRPAGQMSGGEQQMLTIARALMGQPLLLLLDEPSEGVAPKIVESMAQAILAMKQAGQSILLSEQNSYFCDAIADRQLRLLQGSLC